MSATWFFDQGVGIFPLKARSKHPACNSWDDYRCERRLVKRFQNYGVRLGPLAMWVVRGVDRRNDGLAVVDADCIEARGWCSTYIPHTPFQVRTGRGVHHYLRLRSGDGVPKFIHRDGLTIEFKHAGQYVVGPGSIHPSGATYTASDWSWRWEDIPIFPAETFIFDDGSCGRRSTPGQPNGDGYEFPDRVAAGERHAELFKQLRQFKAWGNTKETTREFIHLCNTACCQPPLAENHTFEEWFNRAWANPDRLLEQFGPRIPLDIDVNKAGWL